MRRAQYIRTVLAWHDHTQTDLGRLIGCTQVAAGRKLRAQRRFTDDELLTIADAYGLNPAHLLRPPPLDDVLGPGPLVGVLHFLPEWPSDLPFYRPGMRTAVDVPGRAA